jgi:hypothetical protein
MAVSITPECLVNYCEFKNHLANDDTVLSPHIDCNSTTCKESSSYVDPKSTELDKQPEEDEFPGVSQLKDC